MCRQFYRSCRDCRELFPMQEPGMREPCELFRKALDIEPHLAKCPENEVKIVRPPSGHGGRVCETCSRKNRNAQRERENFQKRERRAKLKINKMTAGIGKGNVVWTAPKTWRASVVDTPTLALPSPEPQPLNTINVRMMAQAHQYGLDSSASTASIVQGHANILQEEGGVYSQSSQASTSTREDDLHSQEHGQNSTADGTPDNTKLCHHYEGNPQCLPTPMMDTPVYEESHQLFGLGITMGEDAKGEQSHAETSCSSDWECNFRDELMKWSTVWDPDDAED